MLARQAVSLSSMPDSGGGSSVATEASARGECIEDDWVLCGIVDPLFQWFSDGLVPSSARSVGSISSVWVKRSVGRVVA